MISAENAKNAINPLLKTYITDIQPCETIIEIKEKSVFMM